MFMGAFQHEGRTNLSGHYASKDGPRPKIICPERCQTHRVPNGLENLENEKSIFQTLEKTLSSVRIVTSITFGRAVEVYTLKSRNIRIQLDFMNQTVSSRVPCV